METARKDLLPRYLTYFCVFSVLIIIIPLFLLDQFWYSHPAEDAGKLFKSIIYSKAYPSGNSRALYFLIAVGLKVNLRDYGLLEKAHIL